MQNYEFYMRKCIQLAKKAEGKVSPNPMVGCVVLDKNGKEISSGYHKKYGEAHAEVNALKQLKNGEAKGGTIIINLEPCSHWGKTPPCAELIIKHGIKRLVIAMKDPNPMVLGKGIEMCKNAGIEVIEGVLEVEALNLNEVFVKNIINKEIFVAIKTATTLDGKIATKTGSSKWITSEKSRHEVQKIRNRYDAILTTSSTIINDNPSMTCRLKNGKNPIKVVLDRELKSDLNSKIYSSNGEKIFMVVDENIDSKTLLKVPKQIEVIKCPVKNSKLDLKTLLKLLFKKGISSVLIESGGKLNGELISLGLADKIYQFIAPKILGDNDGISVFYGSKILDINEAKKFNLVDVKKYGSDILLVLCVK